MGFWATRRFFKAIRAGDADAVCMLLLEVDPDAKTLVNRRTGLMFAVTAGDAEMCRILIKGGSSVHAKDAGGNNALHLAAHNQGNAEVLEVLLEAGVPAWQKNDFGYTPLHAAAAAGKTEFAKILIRHVAGSKPLPDPVVEKALDIARKKGDAEAVALLECVVGYWDTIRHGKVSEFKQLPACILKWDLSDSKGRKALHVAAESGQGEIAAYLIGTGADLEARSDSGRTPLMLAARSGHMEMTDLLIKAGADLTAEDDKGLTPVMYALEGGHADVDQLLHDAGAEHDEKYLALKEELEEKKRREAEEERRQAEARRRLAEAKEREREELRQLIQKTGGRQNCPRCDAGYSWWTARQVQKRVESGDYDVVYVSEATAARLEPSPRPDDFAGACSRCYDAFCHLHVIDGCCAFCGSRLLT